MSKSTKFSPEAQGPEGAGALWRFRQEPNHLAPAQVSGKACAVFPGVFYRQLTLWFHAAQLASSFDKEGEIIWSTGQSRALFVRATPHKAYVNRVRSIEKTDYTAQLKNIDVPTLILTPEEDRLVGEEASGILLRGIKGSREVIMPRTGHMFRFSHPGAYSLEIKKFLEGASL